MKNDWLNEIGRIIWLVLAAIIVGLIIDKVLLSISLIMLFLLIWYLYNLRTLVIWFEKGKKYSPPTSIGIFGDLFNNLYRLQKQQRRRNKRLVNLISRFKESTKAMPDGIIILQQNGEIEWWNSAAVKLINLNYPDDLGQRITNLLRHPSFIRYYNLSEKLTNIKISSPIDDQKTITIRIIPYGNKQQLVMVRDVTLMQRVEDMQRDFIANISHELRTPITVMSGFLEEFEQTEPEDKEQWQHYIHLMQDQSSRMRNLVEDLMTLSRLEHENNEPRRDIVLMPFIIHSLKEEAELFSAKRQHQFMFEVDNNLYLNGDVKAIDSAFSNIIFNAINYSPDGSVINVKWFKDESGAYFSVKDQGIGIPTQHIPRLTERFYRVDVARSRDSGGSGLGLAIVNNVLVRHNATLKIESVVGQGSLFICKFPTELIILKDDVLSSNSTI
ncbi:Phosphate regulon sensor protein PhoR (SphS) [hydrothermal vent metagenome]|uniref:Phosphate regulon sensor protein PhoR n=1 Tax=hydrothermal vent metagenome TaxID=652676 RepID=A0A3B1ATN6_9ZZZZ